MRSLFSTTPNQGTLHIWLLALRIAAAFMLTHGWPKFERLISGEEIQFGDPIGLGVTASLVLAVFAEFFCSILIGIGFATRLAAIPLIVTMIVAAFVVHADDPFGRKELALMYICIHATLLVTGAGKYSVDSVLARRR